jgi:hypothetical protein
MSTIGDIVSLLEKIPIWKRLKALPDEFDALKAKVAALESELKKRPSLETCPICETGNLKVTNVTPHGHLGDLGIQNRTLKCDNPACGHSETRIHDPNGRMGKK